MAIEIVDFPIQNADFSIATLNYQRVTNQPVGILFRPHMKFTNHSPVGVAKHWCFTAIHIPKHTKTYKDTLQKDIEKDMKSIILPEVYVHSL